MADQTKYTWGSKVLAGNNSQYCPTKLVIHKILFLNTWNSHWLGGEGKKLSKREVLSKVPCLEMLVWLISSGLNIVKRIYCIDSLKFVSPLRLTRIVIF